MRWLEGVRQSSPDRFRAHDDRPQDVARVERASPGLGALFAALREDGRHSVLDLGSASSRSLRLLGRFARQIRFMGLISGPPSGDSLVSALRTVPPNPGRPYDVVLAWDVLDRIDPVDRSGVVARLVELTAPRARLYVFVHATEAVTRRPLRLQLVDLDRVSQEPAGPPELAHPQLLPAQVERLLAPFEVVNAFTLRIGVREYVALKRK